MAIAALPDQGGDSGGDSVRPALREPERLPEGDVCVRLRPALGRSLELSWDRRPLRGRPLGAARSPVWGKEANDGGDV